MTLGNMRANGVRTLILKRAPTHRPGGPWAGDGYDVFDGEQHIGRVVWSYVSLRDRPCGR
jgi:hypothetical protein